jgi:hypothetical protein
MTSLDGRTLDLDRSNSRLMYLDIIYSLRALPQKFLIAVKSASYLKIQKKIQSSLPMNLKRKLPHILTLRLIRLYLKRHLLIFSQKPRPILTTARNDTKT